MVKIIFLDIDGTLFSFNTQSIPVSAKKAIEQLRRKGIKLIIATGRALCDINNLEGIPFDGIIASNGALCVNSSGEIIDQHYISKDNLRKLAKYLEEKPFACEFSTNKGNFINFENDMILTLSQLVNIPVPPIDVVSQIIENDVFQIGAFIDESTEKELLSDVLTDCESTRWHPIFADFNVKNISKATGIDRFLTYFDIGREHTMAFGDGGNDISMLKHVAIGVAMGNAGDEVKKAADFVTGAVDEDGIEQALKYFGII